MASKTLMAVGAHADDVEIYAGGTLLKCRDRGYEVVYVMATNNMSGSWKHPQPDGTWKTRWHPYNEMQPQRKLEADRAARKCFGTEAVHLDHPQRHYTNAHGERVNVTYAAPAPDSVQPAGRPTILTAHEDPASVSRLAELILETQPEAVMTHGPVMVDIEHVATCLLVSKAYREAAGKGHDGMLLHALDITRDLPVALFGRAFHHFDTFVDVSEQWEAKLAAIDHHASVITEARRIEFPEWGPACGCSHAEVFTVADWGKQPEYPAALAHELAANARRVGPPSSSGAPE
jgi:LmbE family N-acetylglucosaminyl deacetylase